MKENYDFSTGKRGAVIEQSGKGYQTLINETLRANLAPDSAPLTAEVFRKILHEELRAAA